VNDCAAFRSLFSERPDDVFVGFDLDGTRPPFPTGGNASLYLIDCVARTGNRPSLAGAIGCRLLGAFSDTFLIRFETTQLDHGVLVDGMPGKQQRYAQLNLHIETPVLDQCSRAGIILRRLAASAMVDISAPWVAVLAGASAAIHLHETGGAVGIVGGQVVGPGGNGVVGIMLEGASGVTLTGVKLLDLARPVVAHDATGFDLAPIVLAGAASRQIAVELAGCSGGTVRARLLGAPDGFATGVAVDAASRTMLIETVGLGGASVPVRIGTVPAESTGGRVAIP
jgi:hypothetical protein